MRADGDVEVPPMKQPGQDQILRSITYYIINRKVHHSDGPCWPERSSPERNDTRDSTLDNRQPNTRTREHWRVSNHPKSISWDHQLSQPRHHVLGQQVITGLMCSYVLIIQRIYSSIIHIIQISITQKKYPCLPVGYCVPASISLYMEDYKGRQRTSTRHWYSVNDSRVPVTSTYSVPAEYLKLNDWVLAIPWSIKSWNDWVLAIHWSTKSQSDWVHANTCGVLKAVMTEYSRVPWVPEAEMTEYS